MHAGMCAHEGPRPPLASMECDVAPGGLLEGTARGGGGRVLREMGALAALECREGHTLAPNSLDEQEVVVVQPWRRLCHGSIVLSEWRLGCGSRHFLMTSQPSKRALSNLEGCVATPYTIDDPFRSKKQRMERSDKNGLASYGQRSRRIARR